MGTDPSRGQTERSRLTMIREAAQRLDLKPYRAARLPLVASESKPVGSTLAGKPDWIAERHARIRGAIDFLRTKGVLVSVENRESLIQRYRMTPTCNSYSAEQVIARAERLGWKGTGQ